MNTSLWAFVNFIYNNESSNITYLTTTNMLFVIVTEIMTPVNCTCVHFYDSHITLCPIITTPTSLIPFLYSIIYCTCTQRVMYLYLFKWTIGTDYILASTKGLNWKFKIFIIYSYKI